MKRVFDLFVAVTALLALAPVLVLIALLVWIEDFRFPFFLGWRVGRGGKNFRMVKFRTMTPDAWRSGVNSTAEGDTRITSVGKWLRRTKLDELPQLINVVTGDMSLVGPRPQVIPEVERYTEEERELLRVRPGMTDLASIVFADEAKILDGSENPDLLYNQVIRPWKSRLGLLYVRKTVSRKDAKVAKKTSGVVFFATFASLREMQFDFYILTLTAWALISRRRALAGVGRIVDHRSTDEILRRMARRTEPLLAYLPPGAQYEMEDLLGRPPIRIADDEIQAKLAGRVVLVTGAGGSIGSELCRQIARYRPDALVGFDQAETALYQIDHEIREKFPEVAFYPEVGSIRNQRRLEEVFQDYSPQSVYHAAAYKHVPMMEGHLFEAVENNVLGTRNVAQAAVRSGAEDFVLVSSDKAVRPANVMGATKRLAELVCLAAGVPRTRFMAVRFGNVLGSNGSVIPLFKRQIAAGGPITVTHPDMRRYFMTLREAAQLMLQAAAMGEGGEIFILEMGSPVRIVDLARKMVRLSGLKPDEDIRIEFTGIRPGEKLSEELSALGEDTAPTEHAQIRILTGSCVSRDALSRCIDNLRRYSEVRDAEGALECLQELVPDYNPSSFVLRGLGEKTRSVLA